MTAWRWKGASRNEPDAATRQALTRLSSTVMEVVEIIEGVNFRLHGSMCVEP